jgi:predicted  nucleic acid-binding Zn-ribbon protein
MEKPKAAVTLADVAESLDALSSRLDLFETKIDLDLTTLSEKILSNVFRLAEALQSRLSDVERSDANLKHRLAMLEERLTELEKRLNLPSSRVQ